MPIASSVVLGERVAIFHPDLVNLYGCRVGDDTKIGSFVEIQKNATSAAAARSRRTPSSVKASPSKTKCSSVTVSCSSTILIRVRRPRGSCRPKPTGSVVPTRVCRGASIGSGATILCGITIGEKAMVGAGAVVTRDVAPGETVVGVPARVVLRQLGQERRA